MPTYEYECKKCGIFQVFQSMNSEKLKTCPKCEENVKRLISGGGGLILKGAGFHQNDYKKRNNKLRSKKVDAREGMGQWSKEAKKEYNKSSNKEDYKIEKRIQELSSDGFNEAAISGMTGVSESSVKTMIKNKGNITLDGKY